MRIGILTHHYVKNYGAFWQAYALINEIQRMNPHAEIELINLVVPRHSLLVFYRSFRWKPGKFSLHRLRLNWKVYKMHRSYEKTLPVSKYKPGEDLWRQYDKIIVGSDEVWNFMDYSSHPYKFGYGISGPQLYAYAVSAGQAQPQDRIPGYVFSGIRQFKDIAVRDSNTRELVQFIRDETPPLVADPTLLYDFKQDKKLAFHTACRNKYILLYGCVFTREQRALLQDYAARNQCSLLSAGENTSWCENRDKIMDPFEWASLFRHADYIITGTFHGLMFALIFRKNFICMPVYKNRINKTKTILQYIGMTDRFLEPQETYETFGALLDQETDYRSGSKKIEELVHASKNYLWRILNE